LGESDTGTKLFRGGGRAYREAEKEYTLEKTPVDWAMAQNNLGTALAAWGPRTRTRRDSRKPWPYSEERSRSARAKRFR